MKQILIRPSHWLLLAAVLPLGVLAAPGKDAPEWVGYRYADRSGATVETVQAWTGGGPKHLWTVELGKGYSAVVEANGLAYTMGNAGGLDVVYALDPKTGESKWEHDYTCAVGQYKGPRSTPTVTADRVFTVSRKGHLFCLDAKTGKEIWARHAKDFGLKPPQWGFACSPLIYGDKVIYDLGKVVALDAATGKTAWQSANFGAAYSSPVPMTLGSVPAIVAFPQAGLVVVNADDGKTLTKYDWKTEYGVNAMTPIVDDEADTVFISSGYNRGGALIRLGSGRAMKLWENRNMACQMNTPVLKDGRLYGISGNNGGGGQLVCMDWKTGNVVWRERNGSVGTGSVLLAGDSLVIQGERGDVLLADATPDGYRERAKAKVLTGTCWTAPMLFENRLYVRNDAGKLICLEVQVAQ